MGIRTSVHVMFGYHVDGEAAARAQSEAESGSVCVDPSEPMASRTTWLVYARDSMRTLVDGYGEATPVTVISELPVDLGWRDELAAHAKQHGLDFREPGWIVNACTG